MPTLRKHQRIYLVGKLNAKYSGQKSGAPRGTIGEFALNLYEIEVTQARLTEISPEVEGGYGEAHSFALLPNVAIALADKENEEKDPLYFKEDLGDVLLSEVELADVVRSGNQTFGTIYANIYAVLHEEGLSIAKVPLPVKKRPVQRRPVRIGRKPEVYEDFSFWDLFGYVAWIIPAILGFIAVTSLIIALAATAPFVLFLMLGAGALWGLSWVFDNFNYLKSRKEKIHLYAGSVWRRGGILFLLFWMAYGFHVAGMDTLAYMTGFMWLVTLGLAIYVGINRGIDYIVYGPISIMIVVFGFVFFSEWTRVFDTPPAPKEEIDIGEFTEFFFVKDSLHMANADTAFVRHHRIWKDFDGRHYKAPIEVSLLRAEEARAHRENLGPELKRFHKVGWNEIYGLLADYDRKHLDRVYKMLDSIHTTQSLDLLRFAEVAVSCIQDIPYVLVHNGACEDRTDDFSVDYHKKGRKCHPNSKYGVLGPAEFTASLSGDCDTRTLWLYTVLTHFGYDVVLLGSSHFSHSILGIVLPVTGKFKMFQGKKYYVWETTAKNWKPGVLSPDISNMDYWKVEKPFVNLLPIRI